MSENNDTGIDNLLYKQLSISNNSKGIKPEQLCYYLLDAFNVYREVNGFEPLTMKQFIDSQPIVKHDGSGPLLPKSFEDEINAAIDRLTKLNIIRKTSPDGFQLVEPITNDALPYRQLNLFTDIHKDGPAWIDMDKLEDEQC